MVPKVRIITKKGKREISSKNILFIKSEGAYIELHTTNEIIIQRMLLKDIETLLPKQFVRIHRSYIINKDVVDKKTSTIVTVGEHELPISRNYKKNLA